MIEPGNFIYSPLGKPMKKQTKTIEDHGKKQIKTIEDQGEKQIEALENRVEKNFFRHRSEINCSFVSKKIFK